jgi:asparagine synthetase B (glutamine-hydrolysing)
LRICYMCGILFRLFRKCPVTDPCPLLLEAISRRGPDSLKTHQVERDDVILTFTSSVLALRGTGVTVQPQVDEADGSVLCWNGEAWRVDGKDLPRHNDTVEVFNLLKSASSSDPADFIKALRSIEGPFAFLFYDAVNDRIWYGRDCLGRRSLLIRKNDQHLEISSVAVGEHSKGWTEVDADGVYMLNLKSNETLHVPLVEQGTEVSGLSMVNSILLPRSVSNCYPIGIPVWKA